ncbi:MAG: aromatic amino acid transport family protein [bacterium]
MSKVRFINQTVAAVATLAGTIIGVGLFSLPYIANKVGIWTMLFYFVFLGTVMIIITLMYGEITLRTKTIHRLPGYVEKYLGSRWKKVSFVTNIAGLSGAILAYLIVGGGFLYSLLNPIFGGSNFVYVLIFFIAGAILIYFGIRGIAQTELLLLVVFFVILALIFVRGFSMINMDYLFNFDFHYIFLPYGAVLFSLGGLSLIPEVKEMLVSDQSKLKKVIPISILIAAVAYLVFTFVILGLTGAQTSTNAISGLKMVFGNGLVVMAFALGILTTFTSFIALGLTLKKIFWYDMHLKKNLSWVLACFIPFVAFLSGFKDFIAVVGLTGGALLGIDITLIIFAYFKAKKNGDKVPSYSLSLPRLITYSLIFLFVLGIIYQVWYFVR